MSKENEKKQEASKANRDKNGHFVGKCDKAKKQEYDPNVVKIKVVKEKKPKPPKDIEGKLNEMKERTASRFIESVMANNPQKIDIDGKIYYDEKYVTRLHERLTDAEYDAANAKVDLKELKDNTVKMLEATDTMLESFKECNARRRIWKNVALGMLIAYVLGCATEFAKAYVAELEKNTASPMSLVSDKVCPNK